MPRDGNEGILANRDEASGLPPAFHPRTVKAKSFLLRQREEARIWWKHRWFHCGWREKEFHGFIDLTNLYWPIDCDLYMRFYAPDIWREPGRYVRIVPWRGLCSFEVWRRVHLEAAKSPAATGRMGSEWLLRTAVSVCISCWKALGKEPSRDRRLHICSAARHHDVENFSPRAQNPREPVWRAWTRGGTGLGLVRADTLALRTDTWAVHVPSI